MSTVRVTTLPSGLRVATDTMDHVESVSVGAWIGVGARHEPAEVNGVAHMLEHMAFKGTERRSALEIAEEIEAVGGYLNAYTGREQTAYYGKVLAADVPLAVDILADILQHSVFDPQELDRERQVILQEIGQAEDTPDDIVFDHFQAAAFPGQAIGRPVLGSAEIVGALRRDEIKGYMQSHYGIGTMLISAAGRVEHDMLVDLVGRHFGDLGPSEGAKPELAVYAGGERRDERDLEQAHVVLGFPGLGYHHPDHHALQVFSTLFGGGSASRLFQEVREKRGLAYSIYSFGSAFLDGGIFGIYAGTSPEQVTELVPVLAEELARVADTLTESELKRARTQLKAGMLMSRESTGNRAETLANQMLIFGRPIPVIESVAKIDAVDAAAIRRVTERIRAGRPTVAAVGPLSALESYERLALRFAA
ncbi:MAG: insulinase family protein [Alphaproteobacteria bacterium]|nr:insulinase family protein [Alphaproteobacteria bacterium]